jgi:16S rRNA (guanine527-N7)-methyltransferase
MIDKPLTQLPNQSELWQQTLGWQPTIQQQQKFEQLYQQILLGNQQLNLTRITDPQEFWEKHLWDSLCGIRPLGFENSQQQIIDIGTGAGFPGIPVAIVLPRSRVTLLDSTRKKIAFLQTLGKTLDLDNITPLVGRSEAIGQQPTYRETYDLALIRAVGTASVCAEYSLPLLKVGGTAVLYRGHWDNSDTASLTETVFPLGGEVSEIVPFPTPITHSQRHCIYLQKVQPTPPEFPREVGVPKQQPLSG